MNGEFKNQDSQRKDKTLSYHLQRNQGVKTTNSSKKAYYGILQLR